VNKKREGEESFKNEKRVSQNTAQANVPPNFHDKYVINWQSIPGFA